ncbi:hypothetical protein Taro_052017 [Colocasia esculenta]|uniref:Uncharacterized protein n=1 Tax=Colocasia esculenta TaxID=4460 RepID=A0A843XIZ2_COLES|nr:hypothetical protein [Colocasia esculenta]
MSFSRGCLVSLMVRDVGACVVRLWSHAVALVFRELLCLDRSRVWPDPGCGRGVSLFRCFVSSFASTVVGVLAPLAGKGLVRLPARFIFQAMWISHSSFLDTVKMVWNDEIPWHPNPFAILSMKLKAVKKALRQWNKNVFGDVKENVSRLEEEIIVKQDQFDNNPTLENRSTLGKPLQT